MGHKKGGQTAIKIAINAERNVLIIILLPKHTDSILFGALTLLVF